MAVVVIRRQRVDVDPAAGLDQDASLTVGENGRMSLANLNAELAEVAGQID